MFCVKNIKPSVRCALVAVAFGLVFGSSVMGPVVLAAERVPALEQQLIELGWSSSQASDGTITLTPPQGKANTEKEVENAAVPGTQTADTKPTLASDIRTKLENQGWISTRSEDGTITLVPPDSQRDTEQGAEMHKGQAPGSASETKADVSPTALTAELRKEMESHGWKLKQHTDGSIILFPPSALGVGERSVRDGIEEAGVACGWWIADTIRDNTLKLPVDTWAEAQSIAQAWVTKETGGDLRTGKIRKIVRIYVISIVEDQSPYKLRHQLAVRAEDGHLTVLY